jgi:hypothetical protein
VATRSEHNAARLATLYILLRSLVLPTAVEFIGGFIRGREARLRARIVCNCLQRFAKVGDLIFFCRRSRDPNRGRMSHKKGPDGPADAFEYQRRGEGRLAVERRRRRSWGSGAGRPRRPDLIQIDTFGDWIRAQSLDLVGRLSVRGAKSPSALPGQCVI